jgi:hypothetical protein
VKAAVADAMGGCLFLDEAYALAGDGKFNNDAIRTLLTEVENNRTNLLVVLAGYKDKMGQLMRADPGLPRRFPQALHLADYSPAELGEIAASVVSAQFEMELAPGVQPQLAAHIEAEHRHQIAMHNGGLAVNLVEAAIGRMASRVMDEAAAATIGGGGGGGGGGAHAAPAQNTLIAADFGISAPVPTSVTARPLRDPRKIATAARAATDRPAEGQLLADAELAAVKQKLAEVSAAWEAAEIKLQHVLAQQLTLPTAASA